MINIKKMFKGIAAVNGKIHYCYITKYKNKNYKETLCKINKSSDEIKSINYFAKVDCKLCLERIRQLYDYVRVAIWHSNGFFYKGLIGINIKPVWVEADIDIDIFPEDLIDKNNIKEFISTSENYISLIKFINQNRKVIYADNVKIKIEEKIWILKTEFDIKDDEKQKEKNRLQKKKEEVKEQVDEKSKKTKVTTLPYMRRRMFKNRFFNGFGFGRRW